MKARFLVSFWIAIALLAAPGLAQDSPSPQASASSAAEPVKPAAAHAPKTAPRTIALPADVAEALDDRQLIINEIARISAATGKVEIPISIDELQRRALVKWQRFTAWCKTNGIPEDPRDWTAAGWSYQQQPQPRMVFTPVKAKQEEKSKP